MTIETSTNKARYIGDGAATVFPFAFLIPSQADLSVYYTNPAGTTVLLASGDYAVTGFNNPLGGTVSYNPSGAPIPANSVIVILRVVPYTQTVDLVNQSGFYPEVVESALDTLEMQMQQLVEDESRNLKVGVTDTSPGDLPAAAERALQLLGFDATGAAIAAQPSSAIVSTVMQPVVAAATLAAARTALGLASLATAGVGAGLRIDGANNLQVNSPTVTVAGATAIGSAQDMNRYVVTASMTFTCVRANTLYDGFGFWVEAVGADATIAVNANDTLSGMIGPGIAITIPKGTSCFCHTDGVSSWYVDGLPFLASLPKIVTGTYNVTVADNGRLLIHKTGAFGTIIFPAGNTLPTNFRCFIMNGETTAIGKGVGGTNLGSFTMYPTQGYLIGNVANAITCLDGGLKPYKVDSVQIYGHQSLGSDDPLVVDGLADGARAWKTQARVKAALYQDFNHNGSQPTCKLTGNYFESITFGGQPVGTGVFFWGGSAAGAYKINQVSNLCMLVGDGAVCEIFNIDFEASGNPATALQLHQTAICDVLAGCTWGNFAGGAHMATDGGGWTLNIDASYTIQNGGNASVHINGSGSGVVNVLGNLTFTINGGPAPVMTQWYQSGGGVLINMGGGIVYVGAPAAGTTKWSVGPGSWLSRGGATVPGSVAGSPAPGVAPAATTGWVS